MTSSFRLEKVLSVDVCCTQGTVKRNNTLLSATGFFFAFFPLKMRY